MIFIPNFFKAICCAALCQSLTLTIATAAPIEVSPASWDDAQQPQVAIDGEGVIYLVFGRGEEIYVTVSVDNGVLFQTPRRVGRLPKLALGLRRGPRIAISGRDLTVTAITNQDLFAYHSDDAGRTWSAPVRINTVATSAREGLGNLAAGPGGKFYATWLDLRAGSSEIYGSLSRDGGKTWGTNELVYHSPDGHVCECCHPSTAFNSKGDLVVMWRNALNGSRDLWSTLRLADSEHFALPVKLGTGTWKFSSCPMDGGVIFPLADDSFASAWRRDQAVFLALTPGQEQRLGNGTQPVALAVRGDVHVWWQQGAKLLHTIAGSKDAPNLVAENAKFASAAVSPKDGTVVVAFEKTVGQHKAIFADVIK